MIPSRARPPPCRVRFLPRSARIPLQPSLLGAAKRLLQGASDPTWEGSPLLRAVHGHEPRGCRCRCQRALVRVHPLEILLSPKRPPRSPSRPKASWLEANSGSVRWKGGARMSRGAGRDRPTQERERRLWASHSWDIRTAPASWRSWMPGPPEPVVAELSMRRDTLAIPSIPVKHGVGSWRSRSTFSPLPSSLPLDRNLPQ